jgi:hypothetical protein
MSDDLNTEIKIGADASGVEAGVGRAKKSLASLGDAAQKAGKSGSDGMKGIGAGADTSAKKVESATKSMVGSLQRQIAAMEAGDKTSRKYQETLARMRGVDVNALKPYLDQLDSLKVKTSLAERAQASFGAVMLKTTAFLAVAGGVAAYVKSINDGIDALNDLKDATGSTIENISALEDTALRTGTGIDVVSTAMIKFNGILKDAKPGSNAELSLKAIGLSVEELKRLDPAEALLQTAIALQGFADDGNKARITQELFGKALKDVAPFLADLAEKGKLVGTVTAEQAAQAEKFNKELSAMGKNVTDVARDLAGPMVTSINEVIQKFREGRAAGESFFSIGWRNYKDQVSAIYGGTSSPAPNRGGATGSWGDPAPKPSIVVPDADKLKAASSAAESARRSGASAAAAAIKAEQSAYEGLISTIRTKIDLDKAELAGGAALTESQQMSVKLDADLATGKLKLTGAHEQAVRASIAALGVSEQLMLAHKREAEQAKLAAQAYADAVDARLNAAASLQDQISKEREAIAVMGLTTTQVAELESAKLNETAATKLRLAAIADEIDWSGKLGDTYRAEAASLQELAGLKRAGAAKQQGIDAAKEAADAWQKTADSIESSLSDALMRGFEGGKSFGENFADSLVNTFKTYVARELAASISKALMSAFSGQGGWASALASLFTGSGGGGGGTNWLSMVASAYSTYSGMTAGAGAGSVVYANAVGALGGDSMGALIAANGQWAGVATTATEASVAATSSAAAASASAEAAAAASAEAAAAAQGAAATSAASSSAAASGTGAGASSAAAYAGWAALIVAAVVAAENLYSAGYNRQALTSAGVKPQQFGTNSFTSGRGQGESDVYNNSLEKLTRNAFDFLGVSDKWADILSGTTRMATLFGRKLKAYGFDVDIAGANVNVAGYEYYKGGLFRGNKTVATEVDPGDAQAVRDMVLGTRDAAIQAAEAMGLSTHAIESYTGELKINMKGVNDAAEAQRRYTDALGQMYDDMIKQAQRVTFGEKMAEQVELLRDSARNMVAAMGLSTEGVDAYAGTLEVTMEQMDGSTAAAERLAKASEDLYWQMLQAADGFTMTKEQFKAMLEGVTQSMQTVGITAGGIADIITNGMLGRITEAQVGEQLSDMIIGGIYQSIAGEYASQIAAVFSSQIIQPIFVALAAGVPISQAISQAAIQNVVQTAQQAAQALNAIFADPGFRSAIAGIETAIKGVSGAAVKVRAPSFGSARSTAAANAAAAANQVAQERYQLETQLLQLLGNTNRMRERELAGINASNRALQVRIWSLEDAKDGVQQAMDALERAVEAERNAAQTRLDAALETEQRLNDIFSTLRDNVRELRGEVDATNALQAAAARALLRSAISSGIAPDTDTLSAAIEAARAGVADSGQYATQFDRDRATLSLASELERLQAIVQPQLSEAERTIALLETQIEAMDLQLKTATDQMNALLGIDSSVKTVANAVDALSAAMAVYASAFAAASSVSVSTSAPTPTAPVSSGSYSAPKPASSTPSWWASWNSTGYWNKNADLRDYWAREGAAVSKLAQFNKDPNATPLQEYLLWHYQNYGIKEGRKFARGGLYPGGMALVGEEGPELINFRQPGQVYTAGQTADILRGQGSNAELVSELRALREEQRAQALAMVTMQQKLTKIVGRWDSAGLPEERVTA